MLTLTIQSIETTPARFNTYLIKSIIALCPLFDDPVMTQAQATSEDFLLAAKKGELCALRQLLISCGLVTRVTELIHELQRERGLSNIYLVSDGQRFSQQRLDELTATDEAVDNFRTSISALNPGEPSAASVRLFSSIAFVLHHLESLSVLREQVTSKQISATENTQVYGRLIAGLLAVVFEAADISDDPDITRALVAMFNFVQGKEYAGQERAAGLIGYTAGTFSSKLQEQLHAVQEAQRRCFDVFNQFARTLPQAQWRQLESDEATHELARLRLMIDRFRSGDSLPTAISEVWYEIATRRIDAMQVIEKDLASELLKLCEDKIERAEEDLRLHDEHLKLLAAADAPPASPLAAFGEVNSDSGLGVTPGVNAKIARSISELVQDQAERLQRISSELAEARQALDERKLIDKAKGLLIQSKGITEEEAYRQLRQAAMDNNKRMVEVAMNVISVAGMLKGQ